jgi:hypothetical protein
MMMKLVICKSSELLGAFPNLFAKLLSSIICLFVELEAFLFKDLAEIVGQPYSLVLVEDLLVTLKVEARVIIFFKFNCLVFVLVSLHVSVHWKVIEFIGCYIKPSQVHKSLSIFNDVLKLFPL